MKSGDLLLLIGMGITLLAIPVALVSVFVYGHAYDIYSGVVWGIGTVLGFIGIALRRLDK